MHPKFAVEYELIDKGEHYRMIIHEGITAAGEVWVAIDDNTMQKSLQPDLSVLIEGVECWRKGIGKVKWIKGNLKKLKEIAKRYENPVKQQRRILPRRNRIRRQVDSQNAIRAANRRYLRKK